MHKTQTNMRNIIGCMTGTSIDGIDTALIQVAGQGLDIQVTVLQCRSMSLGDLAPRLRSLADQHPHSAGDIAQLMVDFSAIHNQAITACTSDTQPDLISLHGQTVFHQAPVSWQLLQPAPIAHTHNCAVVYDMRAADLAAGGQGAPMTPIADWILFRHACQTRAILNCGGFCNATFLPAGCAADEITGADICACNHILDTIAREYLHCDYDQDGAIAATGSINEQASNDLLRILQLQSQAKRSLGSGDETQSWMQQWATQMPANDLAATACDGLARCIILNCAHAQEIIIAGGGVKNRTLMQRIHTHAQATVCTSDSHDIDPMYREAIAMAILGCLCQDRIAITIPAITAVASAPVAGHWVFP